MTPPSSLRTGSASGTSELRLVSEELVALTQRWHHREISDDLTERETMFVFARGFPASPSSS